MRTTILAPIAAAAIVALMGVPLAAQERTGAAPIAGAGSSFAYPVIAQWARAYRRWVAGGGEFATTGGGLDDPPSTPVLDYESSGSLAGIMRVRAGGVDFGASDVPLKPRELRRLNLAQFPIVVSGIAVVVNIDGVGPGAIKLTGELLADIFLGKVDSWAHPRIKALNPDLKLPEALIVRVRRADGSGTTFNFTTYLSSVSPEFKTRVGAELVVQWTGGLAAKGSSGMVQTVRQTKNAIGYVEYAQARQAKLSDVALENRLGGFVAPSIAAFQRALEAADWASVDDFYLLPTDIVTDAAYPLVATTFVLVRKDAPARRTRATLDFLRWSLERGGKEAAALGYVPLPATLVDQVKAYWERTLIPRS